MNDYWGPLRAQWGLLLVGLLTSLPTFSPRLLLLHRLVLACIYIYTVG